MLSKTPQQIISDPNVPLTIDHAPQYIDDYHDSVLGKAAGI
jgi:hypothetical protein